MIRVREWINRFAGLFHKRRRDAELEEELAAHLEMLAEQNLERGMTAEEARRAAHVELGGAEQIKEAVREQRGVPLVESFWQDVRFGLRMLRKSSGFTAVAVLTLALGIGANAAIFSVVNGVLLRPLPYPEPQRLVRIWESKPGSPRNVLNPVNFMDWREQSRSFEAMATVSATNSNIEINGQPMAVDSMRVSPDFFSVLRVPPLLGRTFIPDNGVDGHDQVVVLSYQFWREEFGGDPSIVGHGIEVDNTPCIVIGVMPESFSFPGFKPKLWTPQVLVRDQASEGGRFLTAIARLKPGVSLEQAQQDIAGVARMTARLRPKFNEGWSATVVPMLEDATLDVQRPLWILFGAVGFVLLIACANVASLLLMRGTSRLCEMAVRSALGATRLRIVRQLLVESLVLSIAGMAGGLVLGVFGLRGLLALIPESMALPRSEPITIDSRVLLFTFMAALLTAVVSGLVPALRISRNDPQQALSSGSLRAGVGGQLRLLRSFVIGEIAAALLLSIGAGLMLKSFVRLMSVDPGFNPEHLVTMHIWTAPSRYHDNLKRSQYFQQLLAQIRTSPGVKSAGTIHFLPLTDTMSGSCFASIDEPPPDVSSPGAVFLIVSSDYFKTMGTPVLAGREFVDADRFNSAPVAVVNRAFVEKYSPHEDVLNRQYNVCWTVHNPVRVVGVVADARQTELQDETKPTIFLCNAQAPMYFASIVVRATGDPRQVMRDTEVAIHRVEPDQAVSDIKTMNTVFSDSVAEPRFQMLLLLLFAGLALVLAVIGIYGVVSNSVVQRTQEIGIRVALGASASGIARMVLLEAVMLSTIAVGVGVAAALALTRLLEALLFETSPTDIATLVIGSIVVLLVATISALLPARRAMRVDPMVALRHE